MTGVVVAVDGPAGTEAYFRNAATGEARVLRVNESIAEFARLTGDANPLHSDRAAAARSRHGRIIAADEPPRGVHGFGYDPLFLIEELGVTTAELEPEQKNAISHRGRATRLLLDALARNPKFQ